MKEKDSIKHLLLSVVSSLTNEQGKLRNGSVYFHSPLHQERTPSFVVYCNGERWHDFGTGDDGDVIDLVRRIKSCSYNDAVLFLSKENFFPQQLPVASTTNTDITIHDIHSLALIEYAYSRGVSTEVLYKYCKEIHQGKYYYIGFSSDNGGFELRNALYKGCVGKKSYSLITNSSNELMIFEGFFDFLAMESLRHISRDVIVLNSVELTPHILPLLARYTTVHCYLDNDQAGDSATEQINKSHNKVVDHRSNYLPYNDVNEYICRIL